MKRTYVIGGIVALIIVSLILVLNRMSRANQFTWGYSAPNGVAISAQARKPRYVMGQPIEVAVFLKNTSQRVVRVPLTGDSDFRLALFDEQGTPIPKTEWATKTEAAFGIGGPLRRSSLELQPGQTFPGDVRFTQMVDLAHWFRISKAGTYRLVVLRTMGNQLSNFAISNMEAIDVK